MEYFVKDFIKIYGREYVSPNVHGLLHIADDAKEFGSLDNFSAFKFENFLKTLKAEKSLEQINNRYAEIKFNKIISSNENVPNIGVKNQHYTGLLISGCYNPQFSKVVFPHYIISIKPPDNCCLIDKDIVCVGNIATSSKGENIIVGRKFNTVHELYNNPCSSTDLGIFKVRNLSELNIWSLNKIIHKFVKLPYLNDRYFVVIPLINTV